MSLAYQKMLLGSVKHAEDGKQRSSLAPFLTFWTPNCQGRVTVHVNINSVFMCVCAVSRVRTNKPWPDIGPVYKMFLGKTTSFFFFGFQVFPCKQTAKKDSKIGLETEHMHYSCK